jgi:hypothetical protein
VDYEFEVERRARVRDYQYVRAGRDGTYWQAPDGLLVRVAAPEPGRAPVPARSFEWYARLAAVLDQAWQR